MSGIGNRRRMGLSRRQRWAGVLLAFSSVLVAGRDVRAETPEAAFAASLPASERRPFETYIAARKFYNLTLDEYWADVSEKRAGRKKKRASNTPFEKKDYVGTFPPEYTGVSLPDDLMKRWEAFKAKDEATRPLPEPKPGIADFLAAAKEVYGFVPEVIDEREFKKRYAREALSVGLTKDQVVRVYALETSGLGTADMVAGVHPIRKTGKPISTALGYAQLLSANTTSELVKHGPDFVARLKRMAKAASSDEAAHRYEKKAAILARMLADAKSVPNEWDRHVALGKTQKGWGIHAINVDGDIGPWIQVLKLEGLKKTAEAKGRPKLSGAEIELMNLAGPVTGLEMMAEPGRSMPTPNFFERSAYGRNTIVRGKTGAELLKALDERMDTNMKNEGAVVFAQVFDEIAGVGSRE